MFREINVQEAPLEAVKEIILSLEADDYSPIVLRGGGKVFDENGWWKFLTDECKLENDQRQYNFEQNLELTRWWEISNQPDKASSFAFSTTPQPLHTDNAWFADPAEINFFIMKKQVQIGGNQKIYPVTRLLSDLKKDNPELLNRLLSQEVTIMKGDGQYFNTTTILHDSTAPKVFWNYFRTVKDTPEINKLCEDFFRYLKAKEETSSVIQIHANTDDCFCFNDSKILHGRTEFQASEPFERVLLQSMWRIRK